MDWIDIPSLKIGLNMFLIPFKLPNFIFGTYGCEDDIATATNT
jgi:hypothetical protein